MSDPVIIGNATLYLGDCRDILPTLAPVDAVITDQPYPELKGGIALKSSKRGGSGVGRDAGVTVGNPWGASLDWLAAGWAVAEKALMTFCTFHTVGEIERIMSSIGATKAALLCWNKPNAPYPARNAPRHSGEFIWCFRKEPGLDWRALDRTSFDTNGLQAGCMASPERALQPGSKKAAHPSQKPIAVMDRLLAVAPRSVCDPFMGTGTTGVSAIRVGATFVGIEQDSAYFDIACRRIEEAQRQGQLFAGEAA